MRKEMIIKCLKDWRNIVSKNPKNKQQLDFWGSPDRASQIQKETRKTRINFEKYDNIYKENDKKKKIIRLVQKYLIQ